MSSETSRRVGTGIVQRGKTYRFTVYMGYELSGKQIRKTTTFVPPSGLTQKKADKLAQEEYINFRNRCKGLYTLKESMRFSELVEEYMYLYAKNKLKPITVYNYEKHIQYHFMDYFGNKKLKDITPNTISHFFVSHKTKRNGKMQQLSNGNAKKLYCILQSLFSFAVSQGYIKETPCRNIILPPKDINEISKRSYLTIDEIPEFMKFFEEYSSFNTIIKVLLLTGMRSGECLALQWEDIDFQKKKIYIHNTLTDIGGKHFLTPPKTTASIRYQYMGDFLVELLSKHKLEQEKLQASKGLSFLHPEMVFTSLTGNYKDRSSLHATFKHTLKGTKFEFMTLHKLRHTNATLLLNNGVDLKIVSEHLGHSNISITGDIYTSILDNSKIKTAITIEQILMSKTPDKHQITKEE